MRPLTSTGHLLLFVRRVPIGICVPIICAKQDFPRDRFQLLNTNAQDGAILLIVREPRGGSAPVTSAFSPRRARRIEAVLPAQPRQMEST
ncbi:hypothetical protein N8077_00845 [Myxococcota bacterium]|nr:hypothetical protein [Myxococcota bacterium]